MDQKPWYQKRKIDASFPFTISEEHFQDFVFHWHELIEIIYVLRGKIIIFVDGLSHESCPGDIVVISSALIHGFYNADPNTSILVYQIGVELFDDTLADIRDRNSGSFVFERQAFITAKDRETHRQLEKLLFSMRDEYNKKAEGFRLAIRSSLYDLALIFLRKINCSSLSLKRVAKKNYYNKIMERVFSYIHDHAEDPEINLAEAACAANMSKFYFTRFFREQTGQTFHSYLSRVRLSRARACLIESDRTITDIAYICGFGSVKTFNRVFKSYIGMSPSSYRYGKSSVL